MDPYHAYELLDRAADLLRTVRAGYAAATADAVPPNVAQTVCDDMNGALRRVEAAMVTVDGDAGRAVVILAETDFPAPLDEEFWHAVNAEAWEPPVKPGEIPISDAANICKHRGCAYVIVFGVRADGERFHVTTYGKTKAMCKLAGNIGDQIAEAVLGGRVKPPEHEPPDSVQDELLEACEHARQVLRGERFAVGVVNKLAKAIARAKGESIVTGSDQPS